MSLNRSRTRVHRLAGAVCVAALVLPAAPRAAEAPLPQKNDAYFVSALEQMRKIQARKPNTSRAKNVILFIGDGYGVSSMTATRIFRGQQLGGDGPSHKLPHEALPYAAMSRTYAHDSLATDSAPSAVAMTTGVKSNNNMLGLSGSAVWRECAASKGKEVTTIGEIAKALDMSVGAVSTARITDATPAAMYAHAPHRSWESDADLTEEALKAGCPDIARQIVEFGHGDGLDVMFGGGRMNFLPATMDDPEYPDQKGKRKDGRDLTREWLKRYSNSGAYAWNRDMFDKINPGSTRHALALFERTDMRYEADRAKDRGGEPSLTEMTMKALDILSKNPKGYVLMVEGGRIDHGSHANNAYRTLTDAVAFEEAIKATLARVNLKDTLVIVTADHSHTLTINGYPDRDTPILGLVKERGKTALDLNGKPYTILSFTNGPGAKDGPRDNIGETDTLDPDYVQQSLVPLSSETHTGEDVAIFAGGPWAHLFQGVVDENYVFFVMDQALQATKRLPKGGAVARARVSQAQK